MLNFLLPLFPSQSVVPREIHTQIMARLSEERLLTTWDTWLEGTVTLVQSHLRALLQTIVQQTAAHSAAGSISSLQALLMKWCREGGVSSEDACRLLLCAPGKRRRSVRVEAPGDIWSHVFRSCFIVQVEQILKSSCHDVLTRAQEAVMKVLSKSCLVVMDRGTLDIQSVGGGGTGTTASTTPLSDLSLFSSGQYYKLAEFIRSVGCSISIKKLCVF